MENNSTETTAAEAAPKTAPVARRSRRATAATGETVAPAAVTEAPVLAALETPSEAAPKKRATRSRTVKADAAAANGSEARDETPSGEDKAPVSAEPSEVTAPVKKRAPRSRKKAAEPVAVGEVATEAAAPTLVSTENDASSTAAAAPAAQEETPEAAPKKRQSRSRKKANEAEPSAQATPASETETSATESVSAAAETATEETAANASEKPQRTRSRNGQNRRANASNQANNSALTESTVEAVSESADAAASDSKTGQQKTDDAKQSDSQSRSNRTRQRERKRRGQGDDFEVELNEDDVLLPVAGILDVLDNYAFVRTSGYLPGTNDVYVSLGQVKKYDLRKGDAVVGAIRQPKETEGNSRQKYNAIVRVDTVNSRTPDEAQKRSEFTALTAIAPDNQLKLETAAEEVAGRLLDLFAPIGRGQRAIVRGATATGKTALLRSIAAAVSANAPETHIMYVAVDARPEEITELQRTINGEVIGSSFDRAVEDHTTAAELTIERAKRLVELGHDVVVLLDSVTRLGRAFVQQHTSNSRSTQVGFDASHVAPLKRLLAAARNLENGGSLTVIAAATETSVSQLDERVREELESVWNTQIVLSAELARLNEYPALHIAETFTRQAEQLIGAEAAQAVTSVRRTIAEQLTIAASATVRQALAKTANNGEFLALAQRKQGL